MRIVDVVKAECLREMDKLGAKTLESWFQQLDGEKYALEPTPLLDDWMAAVEQEENGDQTRPTQQIGDAAIALALRRFSLPASGSEVILLLLEDSRFGDGAIRLGHPEVYALSTRAFLTTLQNFGRIPSANDILREIIAAGRNVSPYIVDRPGRLAPGVKSQWTESLLDGSDRAKLGR